MAGTGVVLDGCLAAQAAPESPVTPETAVIAALYDRPLVCEGASTRCVRSTAGAYAALQRVTTQRECRMGCLDCLAGAGGGRAVPDGCTDAQPATDMACNA